MKIIYEAGEGARLRHTSRLHVFWDSRLGRPVSVEEDHVVDGRPGRGQTSGLGTKATLLAIAHGIFTPIVGLTRLNRHTYPS